MTDADWWAQVRTARDSAHAALQRPERVGQVSAPWTLWTLSKNGNEATATARAIHAVGLELASPGTAISARARSTASWNR
jgi:hypothetical protein